MTEAGSKTGFGVVKVIAAFAGGALCGSIAALLLAPRSGQETRKMIGDTVGKQKERVTRLGAAAREAKSAFSEALAEPH